MKTIAELQLKIIILLPTNMDVDIFCTSTGYVKLQFHFQSKNVAAL